MTALMQSNLGRPTDPLGTFLDPPDDKNYELVRGRLVEKVMSPVSSWVASRIVQLINNFIEAKQIGWAMTELTLLCFPWLPNHGRRPDAAFVSMDRLPVLTDEPVSVAPDLVVEVLSPTNRAIEVDVKVEEYLRAGVSIVWIVNPYTRSVLVYRADKSVAMFHETSTLTGEGFLPGFKAGVSTLFPPRVTVEPPTEESKPAT